MRPAIEPGDWLLVDPTVARWPRRGSVVVFREPGSGELAIKRVAARPGDWVPFADGWLQLGSDEAWLVGDASDDLVEAAGAGTPVDSRTYGPVPLDALVARAWFRYWPVRRAGTLARTVDDLLARGRRTRIPVQPAPPDDAASPSPEVPAAAAPPAGDGDSAGAATLS